MSNNNRYVPLTSEQMQEISLTYEQNINENNIIIDTTPVILVYHLLNKEKWRPLSWRDSNMLKDGYCYVKDYHIFVEHTPLTVGVECSPAIIGAEEAIQKYGKIWVRVH